MPAPPPTPADGAKVVLAGWTTFPTRTDAEQFASAIVESRLAACAQVSGPVTSYYIWEGKSQRDEEWRVIVKFLPENADAIALHLRTVHPYKTPQWIVFASTQVSQDYLNWMLLEKRRP
ncbi:MAG: divalent-cation tolerance protein CutA [Puniceicoccales bacterium]|jgi:periplasmic divalent cation tolerance protein|nr:divalent-cation tolerance protein CutA [Puniceicoccales bacterium]